MIRNRLIRFRTLLPSIVLFWLAVPGLAGGENAESPRFDFETLTPAARERIDRRALSRPAPNGNGTRSQFYVDTLGWLVSQTPFPSEEEARRSQAVHKEMIRSSRVVETPLAAGKVLTRLLEELPERMRPEEFEYTLTVIDRPGWESFTVGGGHLYITRPYLEALLADEKRGRDRLAFVLAQQLGHIAREHTRFGYQLLAIQEEIKDTGGGGFDGRRLAALAAQSVRASHKLVRFLYGREQEHQADLFAVHLCRNAGFDVETGLDVLRGWAVLADPTLPAAPPLDKRAPGGVERQEDSEPPSALPYKGGEPLDRLKLLRDELDGRLRSAEYGLFEYDRAAGSFSTDRMKDAAVGRGEHAVIFVHGMGSRLRHWRAFAAALAEHGPARKTRLVAFRYPDSESLARAGKALQREIDRVFASAENVDFLCHSAGGLVFRYYAEVGGGEFRRAVFLGTPQHGSDLVELRPLLRTLRFAGSLRFGYSDAIEAAVVEGTGQMVFDLQPDSLFLRYLNRADRGRGRLERYFVFRGKALSDRRAALLEKVVAAARELLRRQAAESIESDLLRRYVLAWLGRLRLPDEVTDGDLVVSLERAALDGAARVETYPADHMELLRERDVVRQTVGILWQE